MNNKREQFANELFKYILDICQKQLSDHESQTQLVDVLGIEQQDLLIILKKIVVALPDYIFLDQLPDIYSEVLEYITKEYILFQSQENIKDPYFSDDLINFIYEVNNTINDNYGYSV